MLAKKLIGVKIPPTNRGLKPLQHTIGITLGYFTCIFTSVLLK